MTFCRDCRWLHGDAKRDPHWRWMCAGAPNAQVNPVSGTIDPPYHFCRSVNRIGECSLYEAGANILHPVGEVKCT